MRLAPTDERLHVLAPLGADGNPALLRRFPGSADHQLAGQIGALANLHSPAGCGFQFVTDAPWIDIHLERLRHHQPVDVAIDAVVLDANGRRRVSSCGDLRAASGTVSRRLLLGGERGATPQSVRLLLPVISTCRVRAIEFPEDSHCDPGPRPHADWLVLGDSLAQGFNVVHPDATWVQGLARRRGWEPMNLGVGGLMIEPGLYDHVLDRSWKTVTVALGSNHAWSDADAEVVASRAAKLADRLLAVDIRQLIWIMPPWKPLEDGKGPSEYMGVPLDGAAARRLQRIRADLLAVCQERGITTIDDCMPHDHRLLADGLHPGAWGAHRYAEAVDERLTAVGAA